MTEVQYKIGIDVNIKLRMQPILYEAMQEGFCYFIEPNGGCPKKQHNSLCVSVAHATRQKPFPKPHIRRFIVRKGAKDGVDGFWVCRTALNETDAQTIARYNKQKTPIALVIPRPLSQK